MLKLMQGQKLRGPKYKFGIEIPRNAKHAIELNKQNGNTFWQDAMKLEVDLLKNFQTFKILAKGVRDFPNKKNYTYVPLHMVFDVKFDLRHRV